VSAESWAFAGVCVTNACGLVALHFQQRRQHAESREHSQTISAQLRPNGNRSIPEGGSLADALHRIECRLDSHIVQHHGGGR
jgi:hypothetical protein